MILSIAAAAAIAAHLGSALPSESTLLSPVQYCGNGYDIDIYGRCYPNGVIPPQYQAARRGRYGYGGADIRCPAATAPTPISAMGCAIQMAPCPHNFRVAAR